DTAVGKWYPLGAGAARQIDFAPGEFPQYGAVGSFGLRGLEAGGGDREMLAAGGGDGVPAGAIYNLGRGRVIPDGGGASGAHSDIAHPEVAHAVWEAAGGR